MGVMDNIKRKLSDISFQRKGSPNREVKAINIKHAQKNAAHRAEADVYESINELRFYRDTIFAQSS